MANNNGYVIASLTPGWIKKRVPDNLAGARKKVIHKKLHLRHLSGGIG